MRFWGSRRRTGGENAVRSRGWQAYPTRACKAPGSPQNDAGRPVGKFGASNGEEGSERAVERQDENEHMSAITVQEDEPPAPPLLPIYPNLLSRGLPMLLS